MAKVYPILILGLCCLVNSLDVQLDTCPAGFYCPIKNGRSWKSDTNHLPIPCPIGTFSEAGDGVCRPCQPGYYTLENGTVSCEPCPPGYMCKVPSESPKVCPRGSYTSCIAQECCTPCPMGSYNLHSGSTRCIKCPAGTKCNPVSVPVCGKQNFRSAIQFKNRMVTL